MAVVYQHKRNDTNEIFYIGIGKSEKRAYHKTSDRRNSFWMRTVKKAGGRAVEILFDDVDESQAIQIEKYLIKYYGRKDLGQGTLVNLTDGGEGFDNLSSKVILKGDKHYMWGQKDDKHHNSKPIYQYSLDGKFIKEYNSVASVEYGNKCSMAALGGRKTAYGYQWSFEYKDTLEPYVKVEWSQERRDAMSSVHKNKGSYIRKEYTCPHCNKIGKGPNMARYHFDNCKKIK